MRDYGNEIAKAGLEIKAMKLNSEKPFQWASGFMMPIYNDNRMFLFFPEHRQLIDDAFVDLLNRKVDYVFDVVAGTSTAGIPHGSRLADRLDLPFIYIRDKPKGHGLKNQIEGIDAESDLGGKKVIVIEDLISTGGSSAKAVQAVRDANGEVRDCFSIFSYGLTEALEMFQGNRSFDKEEKKYLNPACNVNSLLTYDVLLEVAKEKGYLNAEQVKVLEGWRLDPTGWGAKHGFPKVGKGDKK